MKNRYFLTGIVKSPITGDKMLFNYRQLTADADVATATEGMMYTHMNGRVIETDAIFPFEVRQKVTCDDGRVMIIQSVQTVTRQKNSPASRYSQPVQVTVITLS